MTRALRTLDRWPESVSVEAPASSANLGPGFDALALALDMWLHVTITPITAGAEEMTVEGEGADQIGMDAGNRFLIGLEHGLEEFGLEPPVMRIAMRNEIPLARGLGSSAAACVAGLFAAEALAGQELAVGRRLELATQIDGHPDNVSAAIEGGFVIVARSDEGTRTARFDPPTELHAALFIPTRPLRTASMRAALPKFVPHADASHNGARTALVATALSSGRLELLSAMGEDRLHEPYRASAFPEFIEIAEAARTAGALGAALSGAGSTIIALSGDAAAAERAGAAMAKKAHELNLPGSSQVVRPAMRGASRLETAPV